MALTLIGLGAPTPAAAAEVLADGRIDTIPLGDGYGGAAADISDAGVVVGSRVAGNGRTEAYLYRIASDELLPLGALDGGSSAAFAVNESGIVVGAAERADGRTVPFAADPANGYALTELSGLGGDYAAAIDVTDSGLVLIEGVDGAGAPGHLVLDLEDGAALALQSDWTAAVALADDGTVLGRAMLGSSTFSVAAQGDPAAAPTALAADAGWGESQRAGGDGAIYGVRSTDDAGGSRLSLWNFSAASALASPVAEPALLVAAGASAAGIVAATAYELDGASGALTSVGYVVDASGAVRTLPVPSGGSSALWGMNAHGVAVGSVSSASGAETAVIVEVGGDLGSNNGAAGTGANSGTAQLDPATRMPVTGDDTAPVLLTIGLGLLLAGVVVTTASILQRRRGGGGKGAAVVRRLAGGSIASAVVLGAIILAPVGSAQAASGCAACEEILERMRDAQQRYDEAAPLAAEVPERTWARDDATSLRETAQDDLLELVRDEFVGLLAGQATKLLGSMSDLTLRWATNLGRANEALAFADDAATVVERGVSLDTLFSALSTALRGRLAPAVVAGEAAMHASRIGVFSAAELVAQAELDEALEAQTRRDEAAEDLEVERSLYALCAQHNGCDPLEPESPVDTASGPSAHSRGDPHLRTFDGYAYDFQAQGELWFARSAVDDFAVQVGYGYGGGVADGVSFSYTERAAVRFGGEVISRDEDGVYRVGGEVVSGDAQAASGMTLVEGAVTLPDGTWVDLRSSDVAIRIAEERIGTLSGLAGDADGEVSDDVLVIGADDEDHLYGDYAASVEVAEADRFLPGLRWAYRIPDAIETIDDFSAAQVAEATAVCLAAGWTADGGIEYCVLDVLLTGDVQAAAAPERRDAFEEIGQPVEVAENAPRIDDVLAHGIVVVPDDGTPVALADEELAGYRYLAQVPEGHTLVVVSEGSCTSGWAVMESPSAGSIQGSVCNDGAAFATPAAVASEVRTLSFPDADAAVSGWAVVAPVEVVDAGAAADYALPAGGGAFVLQAATPSDGESLVWEALPAGGSAGLCQETAGVRGTLVELIPDETLGSVAYSLAAVAATDGTCPLFAASPGTAALLVLDSLATGDPDPGSGRYRLTSAALAMQPWFDADLEPVEVLLHATERPGVNLLASVDFGSAWSALAAHPQQSSVRLGVLTPSGDLCQPSADNPTVTIDSLTETGVLGEWTTRVLIDASGCHEASIAVHGASPGLYLHSTDWAEFGLELRPAG